LSKTWYNLYIKEMTVGEIKTHFSEILQEVKTGKKFGILYGRTKKPIAMIVPYDEGKSERKIGILDGKIKIEFRHDFEMTSEELLEIR
jgi:antitoxin (DNA-binding transcriptional repressor) of toxin-antitoxin stability system